MPGSHELHEIQEYGFFQPKKVILRMKEELLGYLLFVNKLVWQPCGLGSAARTVW